jgi:hypothetical protein
MTDNGNVIQVPESVTIHIAQGAILRMFDPAAGPTPLYLHGRLECGCYRIFHDLSESPVPLVLADSAPAEVRPEWFGAEADNVYDDALGQDDLSQLTDATSALRASLASLPRVGGVICFLPGQYLVTSEIVIDKNAVLFRGAGRQGNASAGTKQHGSYLAFGGGGVRTGTEGACCGSRG